MKLYPQMLLYLFFCFRTPRLTSMIVVGECDRNSVKLPDHRWHPNRINNLVGQYKLAIQPVYPVPPTVQLSKLNYLSPIV
ncbi:hypothetical protein QUB05_17710 [Microcoleus sp. F10-C6]|uniref:hypothetical protein n=1 Tax=unclassified Microcoleus TaxID=2642155 RepID=UPI002FD53EF8